MKKKKGLVHSIIEYILTFLSLLLCIYITTEVIVSNIEDRPPRIFNLSVSYVPTGSMEPTITSSSYVLFKKISFDDVEVGDIIVYKSNEQDKYIIHRVVEKYNDYLITKGDNNIISDTERITSDMVYGKYIMTLGFMSIFSGGISKNIVFFILIIIFILMIIMQIISILVKNKNEQIKKDIEIEKEKIKEELKKQILAEEIEKIKEELKNNNDNTH